MRAANVVSAGLQLVAPEAAHRIAIFFLRSGLVQEEKISTFPELAISALGRNLPHPLGLAAGFDKDAIALGGLARLGFAFLEAGTVTPQPQPGNPPPRLFRLPKDKALINRMGFNSAGADAFVANLRRFDRVTVPVGVNIGINKDSANPVIDYAALAQKVAPYCDYIAINISSPNTPGLRDLQVVDRLAPILDAIRQDGTLHRPLFVKLGPDLPDETLPELVSLAIQRRITGLIISNTTTTRPATLRSPSRNESGGLSGAPLFSQSTRMLAKIRQLAGDHLVLIGVGGVATPEQALTKIRAGASLVQIYTSFVGQGPSIISHIVTGLARLVDRHGVQNISSLIGRDADRFAERSP